LEDELLDVRGLLRSKPQQKQRKGVARPTRRAGKKEEKKNFDHDGENRGTGRSRAPKNKERLRSKAKRRKFPAKAEVIEKKD